MSAVWRVARAAVGRRRLQTAVIGLVVTISTATIVLALGLLVSSSAPFDRAHEQQSVADLVAAFDRTQVTDDQLTRAAAGAEAVAGPLAQLTLDTSQSAQRVGPSLTTVGRADPGGPVDRVDVWEGRWAAAPGEIVLNLVPGTTLVPLGSRIEVPGQPALTVVGFAYSVSASADAWVTPAQAAALQPTASQVLYRFAAAATAADIAAGQAAVTAGLPPGALLGAQSYLTVKQQLVTEVGVYVPFLVVFGFLGLAVAVLIVANVVGGAVVAGYRDIGMLKALGFTPDQVMGVYLVMVLVPSAAGCVLGTVLGNVVARPLLADAFQVFGAGAVGIDVWVDVAALLGMPAVVALAALVSALRARRLPAAAAISAGSAPRPGRALAVQRRLSGLRLPRSVSLGLGVPFARPARSGLTLAAVVLGVTTVTLAIGVTLSVNAYNSAVRPSHPDRIDVVAGGPALSDGASPKPGAATTLTDAEDEALLRTTPGAELVAAVATKIVNVVGGQQTATIEFSRGDSAALAPQVTSGHWPDGPGQVAVPSRFLNQRGLAIGDTVTVELAGQRTPVRIVGVVLTNNADTIFADWSTLTLLDPAARADTYTVELAPGTDQQAYRAAIEAGDPGLTVLPPRDGTSSQAVVLISSATLLTLVLGAVAALGVFNTVVLNARERRRDLGMLKSIGMTPRQVTVMLVTSMGALGLVGGLIGVPLGILAHRVVAPAMMRAAQSDVFGFVLDVYRAPVVALLALAGIVIAVAGALIPARGAARTPIAAVLRSE
ncbi:ABC transporter permease [Amycolatopsis tucumanensis]|uniref:ABC3 transporter permease C-terminal domain-containing protein n=1 Tax=Amycolatopsis tucumanensis TaxID=401106 RepID=A0ABP7I9S6_9PSEU|nr:ABC transporter permease [Amycolatopsis tucumanensis]MCF6428527.1 ABC transporter permease [Amycolatopsis tucumanensis]